MFAATLSFRPVRCVPGILLEEGGTLAGIYSRMPHASRLPLTSAVEVLESELISADGSKTGAQSEGEPEIGTRVTTAC